MKQTNNAIRCTLLFEDLGKDAQILEGIMLKYQHLFHAACSVPCRSDIEIESELPGVRSKADGIDLVFSFVL
jgi:hypothetical protein